MSKTVTAINGRSLDGKKHLLCVVAKRTYTFGARRVSLADEQTPLYEKPIIAKDEHGEYGFLQEETDCLSPKVATDIVVTGHAEPPNPAPQYTVAIRLGSATRTALALGERCAEVSHKGDVRFPDPKPFERVALTWQNAFGGYDAFAHEEYDPPERRNGRRVHPGPRPEGIFAYPRNKAGRAYFLDLDRDRADGALLPQVEDPADRLTPERWFVPGPLRWIDAPVPGGFGWVAHSWYPRLARLAGAFLEHDPPERPLREATFADGDDLGGPFVKNRILPRGIQGAVPGLATSTLQGGEPLVLRGFSAKEPEIVLDLPRERPHLYLEPPGSPKVLEPAAVLQTVRIDTDARTIALVFCGAIRALAPLTDEQLQETRTAARWR